MSKINFDSSVSLCQVPKCVNAYSDRDGKLYVYKEDTGQYERYELKEPAYFIPSKFNRRKCRLLFTPNNWAYPTQNSMHKKFTFAEIMKQHLACDTISSINYIMNEKRKLLDDHVLLRLNSHKTFTKNFLKLCNDCKTDEADRTLQLMQISQYKVRWNYLADCSIYGLPPCADEDLCYMHISSKFVV